MAPSAAGLLAAFRVGRRRQRLHDAAMRNLRTVFGGPLTVEFDAAIIYAHDAVIRRRGGGYAVWLSPLNPKLTSQYDADRLPAYLYWLMQCGAEVREISVTLADGDRPSAASFAPSTFLPDVTALPDPHFFSTGGYAAERTLSLSEAAPWDTRSGELVWRGGMNSPDSFDLAQASMQPQRAAQRLLACLALRGVPDTDVRFSWAGQPDVARLAYERTGIVGEAIEASSWLGRKYALDIDGYSNAWSNLFTRLLFGCCVLKVESRQGYRQWYYDRLLPWQHYVPVAPDLSDIVERLEWVRNNDRAASEIAQRGRRLALELTMSAVTSEAVTLIGANWQRTRG